MKQLFGFSLVGISSGIINFLVYNLTLWIFRKLELFPNIDYLISLFAGFLVSVYCSFYFNRKFVFNSEEARAIPWYKALMKMYATYAFTGIVLNSLLSYLWVDILGSPKEIITLINDLIGFPVTFCLTKFWSFRQRVFKKLQEDDPTEEEEIGI